MTTVFREVPVKFCLLLFHTDETNTIEKLSETTRNTFPDSMPPSLCNALQILVCSYNAQYLSQAHLQKEFSCGQLEGICQMMPSNHHHTLLYLSDCAAAETLLKQTILQVLSTTNNAHVKLMSLISGKFSQSRNSQQICRQFHFSQGREDEIPQESEDHIRTWLAIRKCVGVRETQFTGSIRWVRESIVFFSTPAWAWKFRCTFQRQHIVIHWSSSKRIWAILSNWAQPDIGFWLGGNKYSMHMLRRYDSATSNKRFDGSRRQQQRFAVFFCLWWEHNYWYINFVKVLFWDRRFS